MDDGWITDRVWWLQPAASEDLALAPRSACSGGGHRSSAALRRLRRGFARFLGRPH